MIVVTSDDFLSNLNKFLYWDASFSIRIHLDKDERLTEIDKTDCIVQIFKQILIPKAHTLNLQNIDELKKMSKFSFDKLYLILIASSKQSDHQKYLQELFSLKLKTI